MQEIKDTSWDFW